MIVFPISKLYDAIKHLDTSITDEQIVSSAHQYDVVLGSITHESGVIQDPAGSAVGTGFRPMGGGLSGAIYRLYTLDPIPNIAPCESILNTATGCRVLHTHSPAIFNAVDVWDAVRQISAGYYSALVEFIETHVRHGESTLNLCALAAGIFAGRFSNPEYGHLDPTITQVALVHALIQCDLSHPKTIELYRIRLFYFGNPLEPTPLFLKVQQVHAALRA